MKMTLTFGEQNFKTTRQYLANLPVEYMMFGVAGLVESSQHRELLIRQIITPAPKEYEYQSAVGVRFSSSGVCRIMSLAQEYPALVDIHNHLYPNPVFSPTDDVGAKVQYQILQDFSPGAILVQLVFGSDGNFQVRWTEPSCYPVWQSLAEIKVVGPSGIKRLRPWNALDKINRSLEHWSENHHLRTLPIIGKQGLLNTALTHIGIVGLSGSGSAFLSLAKFFFRHLTLIDDDFVETNNLGRLLGATVDDARKGNSKVETARRELLRFDPEINVRVVAERFPSDKTLDALKICDIVIACVDNNLARYNLAEFSSRYMKILVEMGSGLEMNNCRVTAMGCQIRIQIPGNPCLLCLNLPVDNLEPEETTAKKIQGGYIRGTDLTPGEVVTTNMTAATLALRNLLALLNGHLPTVPIYLFYDEMKPVIIDLSSSYSSREECPLCGHNQASIAGWGDCLPATLTLSEPSISFAEVQHGHHQHT